MDIFGLIATILVCSIPLALLIGIYKVLRLVGKKVKISFFLIPGLLLSVIAISVIVYKPLFNLIFYSLFSLIPLGILLGINKLIQRTGRIMSNRYFFVPGIILFIYLMLSFYIDMFSQVVLPVSIYIIVGLLPIGILIGLYKLAKNFGWNVNMSVFIVVGVVLYGLYALMRINFSLYVYVAMFLIMIVLPVSLIVWFRARSMKTGKWEYYKNEFNDRVRGVQYIKEDGTIENRRIPLGWTITLFIYAVITIPYGLPILIGLVFFIKKRNLKNLWILALGNAVFSGLISLCIMGLGYALLGLSVGTNESINIANEIASEIWKPFIVITPLFCLIGYFIPIMVVKKIRRELHNE